MKAAMKYRIILLFLATPMLWMSAVQCASDDPGKGKKPGSAAWIAPDTSAIPKNDSGELIWYGKDLVTRTAIYFGPSGTIDTNANGLSCQSCHLQAGTKLYANSYSAVASVYPKFRARSGTVEYLEKRINDCLERSLNGNKIDSLSREMRAMIAYIYWVGKEVKKGVTPKGASVVDVPYLDREADTIKGKAGFDKHCISCHGKNGQGAIGLDGINYLYPPLWGDHSYNTAAGMYRLSRLAGFIKSNMPDKTSSFEKPVLTDEEAWDIAAYVNSQPRPDKKFPDDWPDISKKPVDHPFGPFADGLSEARHKYGPFKDIDNQPKSK
jgi:thiosulfate dehydrogenase